MNFACHSTPPDRPTGETMEKQLRCVVLVSAVPELREAKKDGGWIASNPLTGLRD